MPDHRCGVQDKFTLVLKLAAYFIKTCVKKAVSNHKNQRPSASKTTSLQICPALSLWDILDSNQ